MSGRWLLLSGAAVVFLAVTAFLLVPREAPSGAIPVAVDSGAHATSTTTVVPTGVPVGAVRLPAGGSATLLRAGLTSDGALPIPEKLDQATWWGAPLGAEHGATLLAGHVDWKGQPGPFEELWRDQIGQHVTVVDSQGRDWVYRITEFVTVHKNDLPQRAEQLYGQRGTHRLVLATCGGAFVGGTEGYDDNRFAIAELVTRP